MPKVDLGMKLTCESCGARFYDLNKQPGICPKCGTANARPVIFKASRRPSAEDREKAAAAHKVPPKPAPEDDVDTDDSDDEDEDVIEDTSDLGEDDDDVEVAVEKDE
ncbi:MAG: TIGR02300 family protein [Rhodospirillaceae bacterium]